MVEKVDDNVEYIVSFILNKRGIIVYHQIVLYWTADLFLDVQNKVRNFFNVFMFDIVKSSPKFNVFGLWQYLVDWNFLRKVERDLNSRIKWKSSTYLPKLQSVQLLSFIGIPHHPSVSVINVLTYNIFINSRHNLIVLILDHFCPVRTFSKI